MKGNEGYWGVGISIITQNFPKSPSILFHPLQSSISQTSPSGFCSQGQERNVEMGSKGVTLTQGQKNNAAHFLLGRACREACRRSAVGFLKLVQTKS
jgi:hypothetical protein